MAIPSGTRLGPYEILSLIGAGGLGEVYRAHDAKLSRDVAIKVLPTVFVDDPDRLSRFQREARLLAALNHPNIATIYGLEQCGGVTCLVMELVPGETLAERVKAGPTPLDEALEIAIQIAEALEAAHEKNIVHRDLKPANVKVTPEGKVKVLDFGLAKAFEDDAAAADIDNSPTLSRAATLQGVIQGTAAYMSPEQARGKTVDKRADIWAFGAVLYEMLTGRPLFSGETVSDILVEVIGKEPDLSALPAFPRSIVERCLRKDPRKRWQAIGDVRIALEEGPPATTAIVAAPPVIQKKGSWIPWAIAAILAIVTGAALLLGRGQAPNVRYTTVTFREGVLGAARFSHDGQTIVYSGEWEGQPRHVSTYRIGRPESRDLGIASTTVAGISAADELAVFRDCEQVFVLDCGGTLATVSLAGGSPRDLAGHIAYADWSPDGQQLAVSKFSAQGAVLEFPPGHILYQQKTGWFGHLRFSRDGNRIAFENHPTLNSDEGEIDVVDLKGNRTILSQGWTSVEGLAWSRDGNEVWFASNSPQAGWADSIRAVTLSGKQRVVMSLPAMRLHDIAGDGRVLLSREDWRAQLVGFFPGDKQEHPYSWLDDTDPTGITNDGRSISFIEEGEVWAVANEGQLYVRSTDGSPPVSVGSGHATISPDGKWIAASTRSSQKLMLQPVGLGEPRELPTPGLVAYENAAWSDDGRFLVYEGRTEQNDWNVYFQPVAGGAPVLVQAGARDSFPKLSPDGTIVALRKDGGGIDLYHLNGSPPVALQGAEEAEYPVRFANGGKSLLVANANGRELVLTLVDLAGGKRTPWKEFQSQVVQTTSIIAIMTPDLKYYAYTFPRHSSVLYLVENLR
jgi:eukaryotic-like serine/threonine-protein kinase